MWPCSGSRQQTGAVGRDSDSREGAALPAPRSRPQNNAKPKAMLPSEQTASLTEGKGPTPSGIVRKIASSLSIPVQKGSAHGIFHGYVYITNNTSTRYFVFTSMHAAPYPGSPNRFLCALGFLDNHL